MINIGILSDTHGFIPDQVYWFMDACDEVWHAGDWGDEASFVQMKNFKPLRTVWGNIDNHALRLQMPEINTFTVEDVKVCMLHIGGYPAKYSPQFRKELVKDIPDIMVCGHSHILKVMRDPEYGIMHFNPGAAGIHGFHKVSTALRLKIDGKRLYDLEVWEIPRNQLLVQPIK